jgi:hypothetical protein
MVNTDNSMSFFQAFPVKKKKSANAAVLQNNVSSIGCFILHSISNKELISYEIK